MRTSRIATVLAAVCAVTLAPAVTAPAHAAAGDSGPHFSVKKLCRDDGATRVRVLVENNSDQMYTFGYRVLYPTGRERLYMMNVWEHTDRTIFDAITVRPGTTMRFTIGAGEDAFSGVFGRRFSALTC